MTDGRANPMRCPHPDLADLVAMNNRGDEPRVPEGLPCGYRLREREAPRDRAVLRERDVARDEDRLAVDRDAGLRRGAALVRLPFAAAVSCFCRRSTSCWRAFASFPLSRRASRTYFSRSLYRPFVPEPTSFVTSLRRALNASCTESSDLLRRLIAAGSFDAELLRVVELLRLAVRRLDVDLLAGGMVTLLRMDRRTLASSLLSCGESCHRLRP